MRRADEISIVILSPHRIIPDRGHFIVEHLLTGEFYEMPQPAIEAMEALVKGTTPDKIELELSSKYPDEEINMKVFLAQLEDMGFLVNDDVDSKLAEKILNPKTEIKPSNNRSSKTGQLLFGKKIIPIYAILFCANIFYFTSDFELIPQPVDLFPFDSMVLNTIMSLIVSIVLLAVHECGHVIAARAYGLTSSIRFGHRLFLPVIETQMLTIWRLPRKSRNIPLLAGLFVDHTILFMSLSILIFFPSHSMTITGILGLIVLQLVMMSIYQCMFFMKTDLYYILQNVSGSYNLLENAEGWLKERMPFLRQKNTSVIYDKEWNIVRGYAVFYMLGLLASGAVFAFYIVPQLIYSFTISFDRLIHPTSTSLKADAILFLTQFIIFAGLLVYSWSRKYKSGHQT